MKLIPNIVITGQKYKGKATMHVAAYSYNELGAVIMKSLGYVNPTTWLQNVNMRYSIRGQLLNINNSKLAYDGGKTSNDHNDLFGMQLLYDGTDSHLDNGAGNVNKFDGRLTAVKWMSTDASGAKSYERSYVYAYDNVARYTAESYSERTVADTGAFNNNLNGFDESGISYDENGNILSLQRNSSTQGTNSHIQIDNLTYGYLLSNYNRVNTITDGTGTNYTGAGFRNLTGLSTAYAYDANGNLTNDYYKGLQNSYNVLNRVDNTTITTGTNQYINYIYDAGGSLIRKLAYNNGALTTTDYVGGFVYINGTLSYFPMPEGRVLVSGSTYTQEYIITDQQGNARISFKNNGSNAAVVTQENSYYGFGLQLLNSPVSPPAMPNKQLYNGGSEWQNDYANGSTNLPDYYQTFNRNYDAAIGRFIGQDPDPESAESMSVYQYAGNIPVMLNDPMGDALPMPGSKNPPPSWHPIIDYGGGVPSDIQEDMNDFLTLPAGWGTAGGAGIGTAGGLVITNPAVIADIFNAVKAGNDVSFNLSASGSYSVTYNNALINVNNTDEYAGGAGIITFGNYQTGAYGATSTRIKTQSEECPTCLIPSTVGHNLMDNYVGADNPTNYDGSENFSVKPVNYTDADAKQHDINYTRKGAAGSMSVFFNIDVMQDDYTLIGQTFGVWWNGGPNWDADMNDRVQGLVVAVGIAGATAPKSVVYWINQALKDIP